MLPATGKVGQAFGLDGENDYVSFQNEPVYPGGDYSISLWVEYNTLTNGAIYNDYFQNIENTVVYFGTFNGYGGSQGTLKFITFTNPDFDNPDTTAYGRTVADSGIVPEPGQFYHLVGTFQDAENSEDRLIRFYVDGGLRATNSPLSNGGFTRAR